MFSTPFHTNYIKCRRCSQPPSIQIISSVEDVLNPLPYILYQVQKMVSTPRHTYHTKCRRCFQPPFIHIISSVEDGLNPLPYILHQVQKMFSTLFHTNYIKCRRCLQHPSLFHNNVSLRQKPVHGDHEFISKCPQNYFLHYQETYREFKVAQIKYP